MVGGIAVTAPAGVHIQQDSCHIATDIVSAAGVFVGVIIPAAFAIGRVATTGVGLGIGGAQHHNIRFPKGAGAALAGTLAVGPGMLPVPGGAAVPFRTDGLAGVEAGNGSACLAAVLTVGILIQISGCAVLAGVAGPHIDVIEHQFMELPKQFAGRHLACVTCAGQRRQIVIAYVIVLIKRLRVLGKVGGCGTTDTPVEDVIPSVDIVHGCRFDLDLNAAKDAYAHRQRQQQRKSPICQLFHIHFSPFLFFRIALIVTL